MGMRGAVEKIAIWWEGAYGVPLCELSGTCERVAVNSGS